MSTPNLKKGPDRGELFRITGHSPDYKPSYKLVMSDMGKVTRFEKYSARKDEGMSYGEDVREYNPNYGLVEKKIWGPDFARASQGLLVLHLYLAL